MSDQATQAVALVASLHDYSTLGDVLAANAALDAMGPMTAEQEVIVLTLANWVSIILGSVEASVHPAGPTAMEMLAQLRAGGPSPTVRISH